MDPTGVNAVPRGEQNPLSVSLPITVGVIRAKVNGLMEDVINLTPCDKEERDIIESDDGASKYQRTKLKIHSLDGVTAETPIQFGQDLSLEVSLSIQHFDNFKRFSLNTSLSVENKKIQWVQMGRIKEDNYFVQLGFKLSASSSNAGDASDKHVFALRQAFVSRLL